MPVYRRGRVTLSEFQQLASQALPTLWIHLPIPWIFTIGYLIGIVLQLLVPVSFDPGFWFAVTQILGVICLAIGAVLAFWAQWIFRKQHTTTIPTEATTSLVTWGPYRSSRNPMYLGLFLFFVGLSAIAVSMWSVLLLLLVLSYVNWVVVPVEERQLEKLFGHAYQNYRRNVRRWI